MIRNHGSRKKYYHEQIGFTHYTIKLQKRDKLRDHLARNRINAGVYYPLSIHLQPAFAFLGYKPGDFPQSEKTQEEVLSLPFDIHTTEEQVDEVCRSIRKFIIG